MMSIDAWVRSVHAISLHYQNTHGGHRIAQINCSLYWLNPWDKDSPVCGGYMFIPQVLCLPWHIMVHYITYVFHMQIVGWNSICGIKVGNHVRDRFRWYPTVWFALWISWGRDPNADHTSCDIKYVFISHGHDFLPKLPIAVCCM